MSDVDDDDQAVEAIEGELLLSTALAEIQAALIRAYLQGYGQAVDEVRGILSGP